jgi:hypothetical protein
MKHALNEHYRTSSNQFAFLAIVAHYVTNNGQLGWSGRPLSSNSGLAPLTSLPMIRLSPTYISLLFRFLVTTHGHKEAA